MSGEDKLAAGFVLVATLVVVGGALWVKRGRSPDEMRALSTRIMRLRYPYALLATGALCALVGVGMFTHANLIEVHRLDLAAQEAGAELDASFVELDGHARPDHRFCRHARRGQDQCYTPIVSSADGCRVAVLLAGDAPAGVGRWSGFISRSNLLSFRRELEGQGLEAAADLVKVLPESRTERANAGAWVALGGVSLLCFGFVWLRRSAPPGA